MNSSPDFDPDPPSMGKRTAGRLRSRVVVTVIAFLVAAALAYAVYHFLLREEEKANAGQVITTTTFAPR